MSTAVGPVPATRRGGLLTTVRAYLALTKARIIEQLLVVTVPAMMLAERSVPSLWLVLSVLVGGAGAAASAHALNCVVDADIDAKMKRTASRPIPRGAILPGEALGFGLTLAVGSVLALGLLVNLVAASLLAFTIFFYVVIYTIGLKRRTAQNIVIGGAAGAFPPMIGWAAASGTVDLGSIVLFLLIFLWTPPHFWALALYRSDDYRRAGVPMLPVVAGPRATKLQMLLYTLVLVPVALAPTLLGGDGLAVGDLGIPTISAQRRLDVRAIERLGDDLLVVATPKEAP